MNHCGEYPPDWPAIATRVKDEAGWKCIRCTEAHNTAAGYMLTVHHFDGNKSNCEWWNLLALCQRCHLKIQVRVDPQTPYFLEHSSWLKPYVAGFYAAKYLKENLTRAQVGADLENLLRLEQLV